MVLIHRLLHRPRYPRSPATFPIWAHHGHRNLHPSACHIPTFFLHFSNSEQNQRTKYREVLIAGDLSPSDVSRAADQFGAFQVGLLHQDLCLPF